MAVLSFIKPFNPFKWRQRGQSKLPLYQQLTSPVAEEKYLNSRDTSDDEDDDDVDGDGDFSDYSSPSSPSTRGSRQTSSSMSSSGLMIPKRPITMSRRSTRRPFFYRLPNRVTRYLCLCMITTIVLFIFSLIRASQLENRRIASGTLDRVPDPPPIWENFEFLTRYYGGIRTIVPFTESSPQYPRLEDEQPYNVSAGPRIVKRDYPQDHAEIRDDGLPKSWPFDLYPRSVFETTGGESTATECFLDRENNVRVPPIRYYDGRPLGFPLNVFGSYELLSLPEDICFERYGRYGPYGYGYSVRSGGLGLGEHGDKDGSEEVWQTLHQVDFGDVDWADTQRRCYRANSERFRTTPPKRSAEKGFYIDETPASSAIESRDIPQPPTQPPIVTAERPGNASNMPHEKPNPLPRTAVVIRCWDEYNWVEENIMNLRALITELSLASGGLYDVHLLVQVKNDAKYPIWADEETYRNRIEKTIPKEFWGLVTLWSETQMLSLYQGIHDLFAVGPDLPVHGVYRGLQMAMQYFAHKHSEYDYFWQWEMDIRYTGHYYDLFSKMEKWAKEQPRKGIWERNARFYFPAVHGTWDDFKQMARVQTEMGTSSADNIWDSMPGVKKAPHEIVKGEQTVWGPLRPTDPNDWFEEEDDPVPPTSYERDRYMWGTGEEADLITLNPIFDPEGTRWGLADDITGYNETDGNGKPPRRANIITASRMSRKLLLTMHRETAFKKHHAFSEMWPGTVALQHGYKAVFVPHPVYVDREWPTEYMARVLNGGRNGASGGSRFSIYGQREHNMRGLTWFYNSGFAPNLYRRWLGLRVNNDGGEEFELVSDLSKNDSTVALMRGGEGRMCLPPMLLHPVRDVELPVETDPMDIEIPESDPAA